MNKIEVKHPTDIPENWKRFTARKKSLVSIRESNGIEKFKVDWQESELVSDPDWDWIIISEDGSEYPCKKDIFLATYEVDLTDLYAYKWHKTQSNIIVSVPENYEVIIHTLEGKLNSVTYPDFIAIGIKGELYANTKEFVDNNLTLS